MIRAFSILVGLFGVAGCALLSQDLQPDVAAAAALANHESKRQHDVDPFSPDDFTPIRRGREVGLTATAPLGHDELKAEVLFMRRGEPAVSLTILTSRIPDREIQTSKIQN